MNKQNTNIHGK